MEKKERRNLGKRNKKKGSDTERYYAKVFRDFGFSFCRTSREVSKLLDNAKVDLAFLPWNVQIKGGVHKSLNPGKVFVMMAAMIETVFPPGHETHGKPSILIHRKKVYSKSNANDMVYMSRKQFDSFREKDNTLSYVSIKVAKFDMESEFKEIVGIVFEEFEKKVVPYYLNQ